MATQNNSQISKSNTDEAELEKQAVHAAEATQTDTITTPQLAMQKEFIWGEGKISGALAIFLGLMNLLGALAFYFPEYLTTPELRQVYSVDAMRRLMTITLLVAVGCGSFAIIRKKWAKLGLAGISLSVVCLLLGGPFIPVKDFADNTPYVGLDWLILSLVGTGMIFMLIERAFPYKKEQKIFRNEWGLDMTHFTINHLLVGVSLLVANNFAPTFFGWAQFSTVQSFVNSLPFFLELFLCLLVADLIQYSFHRAMHEVPFLWRFHAVHHCPEQMDWLAGSRQHFFEMVATRAFVLVPIFVLGFEKSVIDAYVIIVGIQAVLNHSNVQFNFGFLSKFIVTPQFHHWHHSSDREALDRNYAAHFSFLDTIFGSRVKATAEWPKDYGILGRKLPASYFAHLSYPFKSSFWKKEIPPKG